MPPPIQSTELNRRWFLVSLRHSKAKDEVASSDCDPPSLDQEPMKAPFTKERLAMVALAYGVGVGTGGSAVAVEAARPVGAGSRIQICSAVQPLVIDLV